MGLLADALGGLNPSHAAKLRCRFDFEDAACLAWCTIVSRIKPEKNHEKDVLTDRFFWICADAVTSGIQWNRAVQFLRCAVGSG